MSIKNRENLKSTWQTQKHSHVSQFTAAARYGMDKGDNEYVRLFDKYYPKFSGKILEIGAGTGWFAKQILSARRGVEYTVLDIETNLYTVKETLLPFKDVTYITSTDYKKIFDEEYDLLIATHCLSETPRYYYTDILEKLMVSSCFVIDYGGDPNDPGFNDTLNSWANTFPSLEIDENNKLLGASKNPIPVYIGKERKND